MYSRLVGMIVALVGFFEALGTLAHPATIIPGCLTILAGITAAVSGSSHWLVVATSGLFFAVGMAIMLAGFVYGAFGGVNGSLVLGGLTISSGWLWFELRGRGR